MGVRVLMLMLMLVLTLASEHGEKKERSGDLLYSTLPYLTTVLYLLRTHVLYSNLQRGTGKVDRPQV